MGALPPAKAGVGSAVNDTARELGGTLGVAIIGSLFASVYSTALGELLTGVTGARPMPSASPATRSAPASRWPAAPASRPVRRPAPR